MRWRRFQCFKCEKDFDPSETKTVYKIIKYSDNKYWSYDDSFDICKDCYLKEIKNITNFKMEIWDNYDDYDNLNIGLIKDDIVYIDINIDNLFEFVCRLDYLDKAEFVNKIFENYLIERKWK